MEKRVATSTGAWYQGTSLDATRFGVYATAAAGTPLEKVESAVDAEIETVLDKGVAPEELERAKKSKGPSSRTWSGPARPVSPAGPARPSRPYWSARSGCAP